jgi:hypothetical protein
MRQEPTQEPPEPIVVDLNPDRVAIRSDAHERGACGS